MTYSIVARDAETGAMAVAVQSHYFLTGAIVPWGEAGVGVVATQATAEASYGPLGLDLLRAGKSPEEALAALTMIDAAAAQRQVAMVDARGRTAAHTGGMCIPHAGHRTGDGVSVQANMMERETVPDAMLAAYEATSGPIEDRLLAALDAAEAEGGDIRGRQSAAMLVVAAHGSGRPWADRLLELRVEDHPSPNAELRRLVELKRLYDSGGGYGAGTGIDDVLRQHDATAAITRGNPELLFWHAIARAVQGDIAGGRRLIDRCAQADARWPELIRRLHACGMLTDAALVEQLSAQ